MSKETTEKSSLNEQFKDKTTLGDEKEQEKSSSLKSKRQRKTINDNKKLNATPIFRRTMKTRGTKSISEISKMSQSQIGASKTKAYIPKNNKKIVIEDKIKRF